MKNTTPLSAQQLEELGFVRIPHLIFNSNHQMTVNRDRITMIVTDVGQFNEMVFLHDRDDSLVTVHNYDHDGFLTMEWLLDAIKLLSK